MKHRIETQITIDATAEEVWRHLTDLDGYQAWNPFIVSAEGNVAVGQRLTNRLQSPGGRTMTFRPTVTEVQPQRSFEWLGRLGLPGIFDGRHRFELAETPDGSTQLVHSERFSGLLVRVLRRSLDRDTVAGFEAMNTALKTRAEAANCRS